MGGRLSWHPGFLRQTRKSPQARQRSVFRVLRVWSRLLATGALLGALGWGAELEARSAFLQSTFLSRWAASMTFAPAAGASPSISVAGDGPYDKRLGYMKLPSFTNALTEGGYVVERQAVISPSLAGFVGRGFYPPYQEKDQAGLSLYDRTGTPLHQAHYPAAIYQDFDQIPPLVVNTLLFIEDRHLLDRRDVHRNPAVDWPRLGLIVEHRLAGMFNRRLQRGGASTLATQIQKFRHSPQGRTDTVGEKLRQMVSAALLAYRGGPDTLQARKQLVVTYLNATTLASRPGVGEIIGIGDALNAWFGTDLAEANRVLNGPADTPAALARQGQIYREVLGLLLAERRPAYYLRTDRDALETLTNRYLDQLVGSA